MGLNSLSKHDVENLFSTTLKKFGSVDEFLDVFKDLLETLYQHADYKGAYDSKKFENLATTYKKCTDSIKKDYRDEKIVHITGSTVTTLGGVIALTPVAPLGWVLSAMGSCMTTVTDIVRLKDDTKQKKWQASKEALYNYVNNPFEGTEFAIIYSSIIDAFSKIKDDVAMNDFTVLIQGMGWNYFLFRKTMTADAALQNLKEVLELFRTNQYMISTELMNNDETAVKDIQATVNATAGVNFTSGLGVLGMIGISAGIGVGATLAGMEVAKFALNGADKIAQGLLSIGRFSLKIFVTMKKVAPALAIVGGVISIIIEAKALKKIDETFEPYYKFLDECQDAYDKYKDSFDTTDKSIRKMYEYMKEDASNKTT
jgi:hypothetical protein